MPGVDTLADLMLSLASPCVLASQQDVAASRLKKVALKAAQLSLPGRGAWQSWCRDDRRGVGATSGIAAGATATAREDDDDGDP